ncbi:hypothetical protein, partial [Burkholderia multivorans]|uniref:hypothetical protein n=1 Tax=Burkholderia multivorans TaxID=87883 RepID=UPI001C65FD6E
LDERRDGHVRGPDFGFHGSAFYRLRPDAAGRLVRRIRPFPACLKHGASVRRAARWQPRTIVRKVLARGTLSVKVLRERRCP